MLFSEYAITLFNFKESGVEAHEFFLFLIDTLMKDSETDAENKEFIDDKYNPYSSLTPDTYTRIINGQIPFAKTKARKIRGAADTDKFAKYINQLHWENQKAIETEFKTMLPSFNTDDDLGYSCADLFLQVLDDIRDGNSYSYKEELPPVASTAVERYISIPVTNIYYDEKDEKLHIGELALNIPKDIAPPDDVTPEEEIYIKKLLAAYSQSIGSPIIELDELDKYPKKYNRNFTDQRINYYSARRIDHFVRESIADGDVEAEKWKSDIFDYIKDTLWDDYDDGYKRLVAVMKKVVDGYTSSVVDSFNGLVTPNAKKGACHLLANDGELDWVEDDE